MQRNVINGANLLLFIAHCWPLTSMSLSNLYPQVRVLYAVSLTTFDMEKYLYLAQMCESLLWAMSQGPLDLFIL